MWGKRKEIDLYILCIETFLQWCNTAWDSTQTCTHTLIPYNTLILCYIIAYIYIYIVKPLKLLAVIWLSHRADHFHLATVEIIPPISSNELLWNCCSSSDLWLWTLLIDEYLQFLQGTLWCSVLLLAQLTADISCATEIHYYRDTAVAEYSCHHWPCCRGLVRVAVHNIWRQHIAHPCTKPDLQPL